MGLYLVFIMISKKRNRFWTFRTISDVTTSVHDCFEVRYKTKVLNPRNKLFDLFRVSKPVARYGIGVIHTPVGVNPATEPRNIFFRIDAIFAITNNQQRHWGFRDCKTDTYYCGETLCVLGEVWINSNQDGN